MKGITSVLRNEHRLIRRAAACLDRVADETLGTDDLRVVAAIKLLEFFQDFADGAHQEKEERYLFPALLDQGLGGHRMRELLHDHKSERRMLEEMRSTLEGAAYGDPSSRDEFVRTALEYATLQREHAGEEDEILLPLVEEYLTIENEDAVCAGFHRIEEERLPKPADYYVKLVDDIAGELGSSVWDDGSVRIGLPA